MPIKKQKKHFDSINTLGRWIANSVLLALLCINPALAIIRDVDPGSAPKLRDDEALLLIVAETNADLEVLRVLRNGGKAEMKSLKGINRGRSARLLAVPSGRYRWSSLELRHQPYRYTMYKDDEFIFDVRPGRINYPGELIFRAQDEDSALIHVSNRGLVAFDWMKSNHPKLLDAYEFEYIGRYPDPFPKFYRDAIAQAKPLSDRGSSPPDPGPLPLSIEALWRPSHLEMLELSPDGDLLAQVVTVQRSYGLRWSIELIDLSTEKTIKLGEENRPISRLDWVDEKMLLVSLDTQKYADTLVVYDFLDPPEKRLYRYTILPRNGTLVSSLRGEPGHILFQSHISNAPDPVHKLNLRAGDALQKYSFADRDRQDHGVQRASRWFADSAGQLRAAIAYDKSGAPILMHGRSGNFKPVMNLADDNDFRPIALTADGNRIYGTAERNRGQRDLVEFDPSTSQITRTLFSLPGTDVEAPIFDSLGQLIGARYYRDGLLISDYFDQINSSVFTMLSQSFPGKSVNIMQRGERLQHFLVAVGSSDQPTSIHLYDDTKKQAREISPTRPWLSGQRFARSHTMRAKSRDGFDIEAYLTLPEAASGNRPLIVFPHGGPIGVRDDRLFDPEVQFLASLGYAVLQVNFRGSDGFGTAFRKAAERNYGAAIEDDIDAAIGAALTQYPLDEKRMCVMGASYGGYSALVSSIRWPGRFRCAISISGVSDRALFFTASDSARSSASRKLMEERIGDPNKDMDDMLRYSPLYRYRELDLPVMLIHGSEDFRVDYEHTRRLVRVLNLAGRPPVLVELNNEGHRIDDSENRKRAWESIAGFLRTHLGNPLSTK